VALRKVSADMVSASGAWLGPAGDHQRTMASIVAMKTYRLFSKGHGSSL
jgi:hypothetical protein